MIYYQHLFNSFNIKDILYDCGQPLNPEIDIGQAEGTNFLFKYTFRYTDFSYLQKIKGAFVQGIGFWLIEQVSLKI